MKTELTLDNLEQVFNVAEPDRNTMEMRLYTSGYGREYLEYMPDEELKNLYYNEFGNIEE